MKKALCGLLMLVLLSGCSRENTCMDQAIALRSALQSSGCRFDAVITADYGDKVYQFEMQCSSDPSGNLNFVVTKPDSISGISGNLSANKGQLVFDTNILAFPTLAEGQLTPVSAPWVLVNTLTGGYIRATSQQNNGFMLCIDDSYQEEALSLDIQISTDGVPVSADILWKDRRIIFLKINNFSFV